MRDCKLLSITLFIALVIIACDSSNNSDNGEECIGIDFGQIACIGEFLSTDGLRLGCAKCTSDLSSEEFGIEFGPLLVPPEQAPVGIGTQFTIDGIEGAFIPEFESCSTIDLFDFTVNQIGEAIKGEMVGTLENLESSLPFSLSFFINITGVDVEDTFCGFCWSPIRPPCADNL